MVLAVMCGYTVALPAVISFYLWRHRKELYTTKTHQRIGWLYDSFVRGAEFWMVHDLLMKMVLTVSKFLCMFDFCVCVLMLTVLFLYTLLLSFSGNANLHPTNFSSWDCGALLHYCSCELEFLQTTQEQNLVLAVSNFICHDNCKIYGGAPVVIVKSRTRTKVYWDAADWIGCRFHGK